MNLKEILKDHELYLSTKGTKGKRAIFKETTLIKANLTRINFSEGDFKKANLIEVNFAWAILTGANLMRATIWIELVKK